jgi:hypothetical protein
MVSIMILGPEGGLISEEHTYNLGIVLYSFFLSPLVDGARKCYRRPRKELATLRGAAFESQLAFCSALIACAPGRGEVERAETVLSYIKTLLAAHNVTVPMIPTKASKGV